MSGRQRLGLICAGIVFLTALVLVVGTIGYLFSLGGVNALAAGGLTAMVFLCIGAAWGLSP